MKTDLSQLHHDVIFGKAGGRIIWQPRIGAWFSDRLFMKEPLPAPFTGMDRPAIYRKLGCSARIYEYNACFEQVNHPSVTRTERWINETDIEITIHTPVGKQVAIERKTPNSPSRIHVKRPVVTEDDMKVAIWHAENIAWKWNEKQYQQVRQTWQDLGAPTMYMPRVNIQDLYINKMGTENAIYALYDWPDTIKAYFRALDECHDRLIDVINASPIDIINFGDNVHAGTLPPDLFIKHVLPAYQRRCGRLHTAGKFVYAHWDGDTKPLLPLAKETGMDGIEAITPKPQGDVTLEEIKEALGDKLFLLDGIPAVYFDEIFPLSVLEACCRRIIELFAPRLVLGISDEISSTGNIERIRTIGHIVDAYNDSVETKNSRHDLKEATVQSGKEGKREKRIND